VERPALVIGVCAVLAVAGCGDSESSSTSSTEAKAPASKEAKAPTPKEAKAPAPKKVKPLVPKRAEPHIALPGGPAPQKVISRDLKTGAGAIAKTGDMLTIDFLGVYYETGKLVSSSWERGEPFTFRLGGENGILGWEHALQGMRVGGRRELILPARLTSRYLPLSERTSQIYVIDLRGIG
jgi:peptidylprolyl isomerase